MNSQTTQDASKLAVRLRDGSQVLIRPICASDKPLVAAAYDRLSPESRRRRFLTAPVLLSDEDLRYLTEVDHRRHEALIALDAETGKAVGDARYVRLPGQREAAEVATVVTDDWHGRGLATALLMELTHRARANGLSRYTAVVSADNRVVLDALEGLGARCTGAAGGEVELEIELPSEGLPGRLRGSLALGGRGPTPPARRTRASARALGIKMSPPALRLPRFL
jgi:RimJ/RimL family protein N-acetyltransferase